MEPIAQYLGHFINEWFFQVNIANNFILLYKKTDKQYNQPFLILIKYHENSQHRFF
jgi:hypothetical protein